MTKLTLNGKPIEMESRRLIDLLHQEGIETNRQGVAVAVNDRVVRRGEWEEHTLNDGDAVEIVTAMQGG